MPVMGRPAHRATHLAAQWLAHLYHRDMLESGGRPAKQCCTDTMHMLTAEPVDIAFTPTQKHACRYSAELGDVVVGRVVELQARRWAVDVGAAARAALQLGAVALPGDVQRRRTAEDELAMRDWFAEGDIVVAEVHNDVFFHMAL
jgi:hypothetical protein